MPQITVKISSMRPNTKRSNFTVKQSKLYATECSSQNVCPSLLKNVFMSVPWVLHSKLKARVSPGQNYETFNLQKNALKIKSHATPVYVL